MQIKIDVKTINEVLIKPKSEATVVLGLIKRTGIRGDVAARLYQQHGPDFLIRKYFHTEYMNPHDKRRYFQADLRENYSESDGFFEWFKRRKTEILLNDNIPQELKRIICRCV